MLALDRFKRNNGIELMDFGIPLFKPNTKSRFYVDIIIDPKTGEPKEVKKKNNAKIRVKPKRKTSKS